MKDIIQLLIRKLFLNNIYAKTLGTLYILKPHLFGDAKRLKISNSATINNAFFNTLSGNIVIEDDVFFGQNVYILTGSHDYNKFGKERFEAVTPQGNNIIVKKGAWIASNSTIIGPCIIGEHSVIAAGSLVNKNVPSYAIVGGIPARVIKEIDHLE